jgi:hypothetical protein
VAVPDKKFKGMVHNVQKYNEYISYNAPILLSRAIEGKYSVVLE